MGSPVVVRILLCFLISLSFLACSDSVPVATQYKQRSGQESPAQAANGEAGIPSDTNGSDSDAEPSDDDVAVPGDAAPPPVDNQMLIAQGQSFLQQSGCMNAGCHDNPAADTRVTTVNNAQLIIDAASLPVHAGIAAWPGATESEQLFEYFKSLSQG